MMHPPLFPTPAKVTASADVQIIDIWASAREQYVEITGIDLEADAAAVKVTSAKELLKVLEDHQKDFSEFRAHKEKLWARLSRIAEGLEAMAQIASGTVAQLYPQYAPIFGALSHLVKSAKNVAAAYNLIIKSFESLEMFVSRMTLYARHKIDSVLRTICVKKLAWFHLIFALATRMIRKGRLSLYFDNVFMKESDVQQAFKQLEDLSAYESALLQALNHSSQNDQSTDLSSIKTSVGSVNGQVSSINDVVNSIDTGVKHLLNASVPKNSDEDVAAQLGILKKLLDPELSVERDYSNVKRDIILDTGEWILSDKVFCDWRTSTPVTVPSVLWISGDPGQGKTYLSARIISSLLAFDQDPQTSVAYFFCHENDTRTRSFPFIIRTLAYQVARNDPTFRAYLLTSLNQDSGSTLGTAEAWELFFPAFFSQTDNRSSAYIVIDGLDEAVHDGFDGVETFLRSTAQSLSKQSSGTASTRLKLALVGRRDMDYMLSVELGVVPTINVSGRNNADLVKYINKQLHRLRNVKNLRKVSPSFYDEVFRRLSDREFLWVKIVCKEMESKIRPSDIRAVLDGFPHDLQATIHHVLERFSNGSAQDTADLTEMLALVVCARRPLNLYELEAFMAMKSPTHEPILGLEWRLRKTYSTFFTLVRDDGLTTADLESRSESEGTDVEDSPRYLRTTVHISHAMFSEYFHSPNQGAALAVNVAQGDYLLLQRCLSWICYASDADSQWVYEQPESDSDPRRLQIYSIKHWTSHLVALDVATAPVGDKKLLSYLHRVFTDEQVIEKWMGLGLGVHINPRFASAEFLACLISPEIESVVIPVIEVMSFSSNELEVRTWAGEISMDRKMLVTPVVVVAAKRWIKSKSHPSRYLFQFIYAYVAKFGLSPSEKPLTLIGKEVWMPLQHAEFAYQDVITVAECISTVVIPEFWAQDNIQSFLVVGDFLVLLGYMDQAGKWQTSIPHLTAYPLFLALRRIADAYARKKDYRKAVEWGRQALGLRFDGSFAKQDIFVHAVDVAHWTATMVDPDEALLTDAMAQWDFVFRANWTFSYQALKPPQIDSPAAVARDYLIQLNAWHKYDTVISFVKNAADIGTDTVSVIHRQWNTSETFNPLHIAARNQREIPWLIGLYEEALATPIPNEIVPRSCDQVQCTAYLQYSLSTIFLEDIQDDENGLRLLEESWATVESHMYSCKTCEDWLKKLSHPLCRVYYRRALEAKRKAEESSSFITKLTRIVDSNRFLLPLLEGGQTFSSYDAAYSNPLLIAMWRKINNQHDASEQIVSRLARIVFHPFHSFQLVLKNCIDEEYDWQQKSRNRVYLFLARILTASGDSRGARAAILQIGGSALPKSVMSIQPRIETEDSEVDPLYAYRPPKGLDGTYIRCDGPCNRELLILHGMHFCCDSCLFNAVFCSPCLGKLKRRELNYRVCSPDHKWLYITRKNRPTLPKGQIVFEAEGDTPEIVMDKYEWFAQIKARFGINETEPVSRKELFKQMGNTWGNSA